MRAPAFGFPVCVCYFVFFVISSCPLLDIVCVLFLGVHCHCLLLCAFVYIVVFSQCSPDVCVCVLLCSVCFNCVSVLNMFGDVCLVCCRVLLHVVLV